MDVAPAMGMIGTLIGLVLMLGNMGDPKSIGPMMAVALLTTLYGAFVPTFCSHQLKENWNIIQPTRFLPRNGLRGSSWIARSESLEISRIRWRARAKITSKFELVA